MIDGLVHIMELAVIFGGAAGIIAAFGWARAERTRAEASLRRTQTVPEDQVLAELQSLKQQLGQMQETNHQFDLSFDAALTRLEQRVSRVETKTAAPTPAATEPPQSLRNGHTP